MTQTLTTYPKYLADFQALDQSAPWLQRLREQAWSHFEALGFPTARRANERWKYTNVAPIANASFGNAPVSGSSPAMDAQELQRCALWQPDWINLVFVNGRYVSDLSTPSSTTKVQAGSMAKSDYQGLMQQYLGRYADSGEDGFTALNTAFVQDGAFVHAPAGEALDQVVHLIYITTDGDQPVVTHPRTLIVAEANSNLRVVESYYSSTDSQHFTNAVTEIVLDQGANVDHCLVMLENTSAFHIGSSRVYQGQDSTFTSVAFAKGAALGRNDFQVLLDAPGASCTLNGLYLTKGTQHMDNFINIDHAKPYGTSNLFYKGILDGKSRAIFGGTVLVREDAQQTNAQQTDKNLILSYEAEVDSKPSLLIYADDVKCGHGATAGHIDEDTLFYMRSRGLDAETASRLLIHAFASEIIDTVQIAQLRDYLDELFLDSIPASTLKLGDS